MTPGRFEGLGLWSLGLRGIEIDVFGAFGFRGLGFGPLGLEVEGLDVLPVLNPEL